MRWLLFLLALVAPHLTQAATLARFVVMTPDGAVARVITDAAACPNLIVDGSNLPMTIRSAPMTAPLRPTQSDPADSKPSAFPVTVCEALLPKAVQRASIEGIALPLPKLVINRIVMIGDTGCRLKKASNAWQACNDPHAFPFAQVAAAAAAWKPDLVLHVGDYMYRENRCPDPAQCGSIWGYGWDAWNADFFSPAARLLAVAPIAPVRGNLPPHLRV